ncbi:MAG: hypothetical protein KA886_00290, partial [Candidatus Cloacimonetes bacterium]|nr:hypothetical protein [Candidatus Cloacimonadota bacterium]
SGSLPNQVHLINRPEYLKAEADCKKNYLFHFLPSSVFVEQATCLFKLAFSVEQATCLLKQVIRKLVACATIIVGQATCLFKLAFSIGQGRDIQSGRLYEVVTFRKLVACATIIVEQATCLFKFTIQRRTSNLLVKAVYSQAGSLQYDYCWTSNLIVTLCHTYETFYVVHCFPCAYAHAYLYIVPMEFWFLHKLVSPVIFVEFLFYKQKFPAGNLIFTGRD